MFLEGLGIKVGLTTAFIIVICLPLITPQVPRNAAQHSAASSSPCALTVAHKLTDSAHQASSLAGVAGEHLKAGDHLVASELLFAALRLAESVKTALFKTGALNEIAEFAEVEHLERGLQIARTVNAPDRTWAFSQLALRFAKLGQRDRAAEVLGEAVLVAKSMQAADDREFELVRIGRTYAQVDLPDEALRIAGRVKNPYQRGEVLRAAAAVLAEQKQSQRAFKVAASIHYEIERLESLVEVATRAGKNGDDNTAVRALAAAHRLALRNYFDPRDDGQTKALVIIAAGHLDNGRSKEALAILAEAARIAPTISKSDFRAAGLARVAAAYARARAFPQALRLSQVISDGHVKASALADVAENMLATGESALALELLAQAVAAAEPVDCSYYKPFSVIDQTTGQTIEFKFNQCLDWKAAALVRVAEVFIAGGATEQAKETISQAFKAALPNAGNYDADATLLKIVNSYIAVHQYEQALKAATIIHYPSRQVTAIAAVEIGMVRAAAGVSTEMQRTLRQLGCANGSQN